jgi:lysophospholipase L1-like esterase
MTWRTNKELEELSTRFPANVQLVDLFGKMQRKHFTRHGLHLNASGKRLLSAEIKQVCCI